MMFFNLLMQEILNYFNIKNIRILNNSTGAVQNFDSFSKR